MNRFTKSFADADTAFSGQYLKELEQLKGLTDAEIASVLPNTTNIDIYEKLIEVVGDASKKNMEQAELVSKIKNLGNIAVKLANKIPGLAVLF